jgi:hypothetical protein
MSKYGIKLLWAGWQDNETVIGFSPQAYERWKDDIQVGTRMLIYETTKQRPGSSFRSAKGLIGEVEVIEGFAKSSGLATPTEEHDQPVKVKVIRGRSSVDPIPLERVRKILADPKFPQQGEAWRPIFETMYRDFLKIWGER